MILIARKAAVKQVQLTSRENYDHLLIVIVTRQPQAVVPHSEFTTFGRSMSDHRNWKKLYEQGFTGTDTPPMGYTRLYSRDEETRSLSPARTEEIQRSKPFCKQKRRVSACESYCLCMRQLVSLQATVMVLMATFRRPTELWRQNRPTLSVARGSKTILLEWKKLLLCSGYTFYS